MSLVTVVAAIVWQAGSLTARLRVRAAATALVSDLRAAQALAMAERRSGRAHGLQFEPGSDRYFIVVRDDSTTTQSRLRRLPDGVRVTYARFGGALPTSSNWREPSGATQSASWLTG